MKRALHQAIIFFTLLLLVTLLRMPYGSYRELLLPRMRTLLSPHGVTIDFADLSLGPPVRMLLEKMNLWVPLPIPVPSRVVPIAFVPIPLVVDDAHLELYPFSLLRLRTTGDGQVHLYQGQINYEFSRPIFGGWLRSSGTFENISLHAHPFLSSYGVSGTAEGKFEWSFTEFEGKLTAREGELSLALRNGEIRSGLKIYGAISIPEIQNINLVLKLSLDETALVVSALSLECSMGSFKGNGRLVRSSPAQTSGGKFNGTIQLTETGRKAFGPYLAIAANLSPENPASGWDIAMTIDKSFGVAGSIKVHR